MLDIEKIASFYPPNLALFKRHILREYLQYKILKILFDSAWAAKLCFIGGTAIRIIHGNSRFSEDLDFDNLGFNLNDFQNLTECIIKEMEQEGVKVDVKISQKNALHAYLDFPQLLIQQGLSGHSQEKLTIRIDTEDQNSIYSIEKPLINKFDVFTRINVVPVSVLLSQKITCLFTRKRQLGRDYFDIVFLSGKTKPNMNYLEQKLGIKDNIELKNKLKDQLHGFDFNALARDVEPFLFNSYDAIAVKEFKEFINQVSW